MRIPHLRTPPLGNHRIEVKFSEQRSFLPKGDNCGITSHSDAERVIDAVSECVRVRFGVHISKCEVIDYCDSLAFVFDCAAGDWHKVIGFQFENRLGITRRLCSALCKAIRQDSEELG